ncbi:HK97 family phage prohead protease, partial [Massilia pseudoviolaceinigra]|uniref:HK97 family phage prohead protease n=1 Tax=Massilia pseudoviolaceinigra TaxID=3057165 RepID=UPI002796901E
MQLLHKSIDLELKSLTDKGNFSGYGSVFNVVDKGGDIVAPGAFAESLSKWQKSGRTVPVLWQHQPDQPIGAWEALKEDDHGLLGEASLWLDDAPYARLAHKGMSTKTITGLSIGYRVKDYSVNKDTGVYTLQKLDLVEISVVTNPMNDDARVADVKCMLEAGRLPSLSEFEKFLREAGFSKSQA